MGYARVGHRYLSPEEVTIRSFLKMKNSKLIFYKDKGYCYIAENFIGRWRTWHIAFRAVISAVENYC
jgi:hypothetical protein